MVFTSTKDYGIDRILFRFVEAIISSTYLSKFLESSELEDCAKITKNIMRKIMRNYTAKLINLENHSMNIE